MVSTCRPPVGRCPDASCWQTIACGPELCLSAPPPCSEELMRMLEAAEGEAVAATRKLDKAQLRIKQLGGKGGKGGSAEPGGGLTGAVGAALHGAWRCVLVRCCWLCACRVWYGDADRREGPLLLTAGCCTRPPRRACQSPPLPAAWRCWRVAARPAAAAAARCTSALQHSRLAGTSSSPRLTRRRQKWSGCRQTMRRWRRCVQPGAVVWTPARCLLLATTTRYRKSVVAWHKPALARPKNLLARR